MKKLIFFLMFLFVSSLAEAGTNVIRDSMSIARDLTVSRNLSVANSTAVNNATVYGQLGVTGAATLAGTLAVTGNTTLSSDLSVKGVIQGLHINHKGAHATVNTTTTSTSYTALSDMNVTINIEDTENPIFLLFSCSTSRDTNSANASNFIIEFNGSQIAATERQVSNSTATGGGGVSMGVMISGDTTLSELSTTTGAKVVRVLYKTESGATQTVYERELNVIEVRQN